MDINAANDNELNSSENAPSAGSLAEFASTAFELLIKLSRRLPTGKTDNIFDVINVFEPRFKSRKKRLEANYKKLIKLVPKIDNGDTYNFITDLHNFIVELYRVKPTIEDAESAEYQRLQEHFKTELVKVVGRLANQMIDLGERYFNSLSVEKRTPDQKKFNDQLKEIKTETDEQKKYQSLFDFLEEFYSELE